MVFKDSAHCYFAREVSIIPSQQPLLAIFKIRCGNTVTKNTMHSPQDTPILGQDSIQAGTRAVHHRFALQMTIIQYKQRCRDMWHGHKGRCNTDSDKHPMECMSILTNTTGNCTRWSTYSD